MASLLGEAFVRVRPDVTGFSSEAQAGLAPTMGSLSKVLKVGLGVGVGVAIGESIKSAADYQTLLTKLTTTAGESQKNIKAVGQGMLDIAGQVGISATDLAKGMYTVESSGIHGANALTVLKAAAQGAVQENADLGKVTDAVTTALHDYNLPASKAADVTSMLVTAVSHGKTTFDELTGAMHSVTPLAAALHVPLADVAGVLSAMTASGESADQAAQNMADALRHLQAPTSTMTAELGQLGINSNDLGKMLGEKGLSGTIQTISTAIVNHLDPATKQVLLPALNKSKAASEDLHIMLGQMPPDLQKLSQGLMDGKTSFAEYRKSVNDMGGPALAMGKQFLALYDSSQGFNNILKAGGPQAQQYSAALQKAMGTSAGLTVALQVTGEHAAATNSAIKDIAGSTAQADGNIKGWSEVQGNFNQQLKETEHSIGAAAISLGEKFLPFLTTAAKYINDTVIPYFKNFGTHIQVVKDYLAPLVTGIDNFWKSLSKAGGPLSAAWQGVKLLAGAVVGVVTAMKPLVDLAGAALTVISKLPGPVEAVVVGFLALKAAMALGLFGKMNAEGEATGGMFAGLGNKVRTFAQTAQLQMALADDSMSTTDAAAGALASGFEATMPRASAAVKTMARSVQLSMAEIKAAYIEAQNVANFTAVESGAGAIARTTGQIGALGTAAGAVAKTGVGALRSGLGGLVSFMGGPLGVAVIGVAVGIGLITSAIQKHNEQVQKDTQQIQSWYQAIAQGGDGASEALDKIQQKRMALVASQDKLNQMQAQQPDYLAHAARAASAYQAAINSQQGKVSDLKKEFNDAWAALSPLEQKQEQLNEAVADYGPASDQAKAAAAAYRAEQDKQKKSQDNVNQAIKTHLQLLQDQANAQLGSINSALASQQANLDLADAISQYNSDARDGQHSSSDLAKEQNSLAQQILSTAQAAGQAAADQAKANGVTDTANTSNAAMLKSLQDVAKQMGNQTPAAIQQAIKSLENATVSSNDLKGSIEKMGLTTVTQSKAWHDAWGKNAQVLKGATDDEVKQLQGLGYTVTHLPNGNVVVQADTNPARRALTKLSQDYTGYKINAGLKLGVNSFAAATGGAIFGPGTATSDSIPAMLSNGEWVIKASSVSKYGHSTMAAVNQGRATIIPHLAAGGPAFPMDLYAPVGVPKGTFSAAEAYLHSLLSFTSAGGNAGNRALGQKIAAAMGYGGQFSAIDYVFSHESGWNNLAKNPTSTAFGIPQFLASTWAQYGGITTDPARQISDGIHYMVNRYGSPLGAATFWKNHHWYDQGGWLQPGATLALNGTGKPERIRTAEQESTLQAQLAALTKLATEKGRSVELHIHGDVKSEVDVDMIIQKLSFALGRL